MNQIILDRNQELNIILGQNLYSIILRRSEPRIMNQIFFEKMETSNENPIRRSESRNIFLEDRNLDSKHFKEIGTTDQFF